MPRDEEPISNDEAMRIWGQWRKDELTEEIEAELEPQLLKANTWIREGVEGNSIDVDGWLDELMLVMLPAMKRWRRDMFAQWERIGRPAKLWQRSPAQIEVTARNLAAAYLHWRLGKVTGRRFRGRVTLGLMGT